MTAEADAVALSARLNLSGGERPVFLDDSGRRARFVRLCGRLLAVATTAWLAALVLGALPGPRLPPLSRQLAGGTVLTSGRVAAAQDRRPPISGAMSFARLTSRPTVATTVARETADAESRAARRV